MSAVAWQQASSFVIRQVSQIYSSTVLTYVLITFPHVSVLMFILQVIQCRIDLTEIEMAEE